MAEILFNDEIEEYTLKTEVKGVKSRKNIPMKFKLEDSTSKFRKEILKEEILKNFE